MGYGALGPLKRGEPIPFCGCQQREERCQGAGSAGEWDWTTHRQLSECSMRLHLDPVGGIAGDMFAAAVLDLYPRWEDVLRRDLASAGLARFAEFTLVTHRDAAMCGRCFAVRESAAGGDGHRTFAEIRRLLQEAGLSGPVRDRALGIFSLLAGAESSVHGVPVESVSFHEVGAWDSIIDVVTAAWLVDRLGPARWSSSVIPMGKGRVRSAHGQLPLPAPAAALLLEGFPLSQDEHEGERVTPTGAAILRHLAPSFSPMRGPARLTGMGVGFGAREFPGLSNVLRVFAFEENPDLASGEQVAVCSFEVDDQTLEDLSVGLERLRGHPGVIDISQWPVFGKKGRIAVHVQVLAAPEQLEAVLTQCFTETTTLGIRWQLVARAVVPRETNEVDMAGRSVRVKYAVRPGNQRTVKPEMDDLAGTGGGHAGRERARRLVEAHALGDEHRTPLPGEEEDV